MILERRHLPVALVLGVLLGAGATLAQWRLACRVPDAEACVWGRAYLPLSVVLGGVAGLTAGAVAFLVIRVVQRRDAPGQDADAG